ncbi:MAG: tyrosine-type recombinase/integrase [Methylorubrum populi]
MGVPKPAPEVRRTRVLSEDEIARVLKACRDDDFGRIVRLLLMTGQRRDEVADMAWAEVDLASAVWSLPDPRVKNGQGHDVPLSKPALQVLTSIERVEGGRSCSAKARADSRGSRGPRPRSTNGPA